MNKLPVLLSIPHGGEEIPPQLRDRIILSSNDILEDIDAFTRDIYDLGGIVFHVISSKIARTFVDLNRAPDDLPPRNPDGVIKSVTCYDKVIYSDGLWPDHNLRKNLLDQYYYPYHRNVQKIMTDHQSTIQLALDCHSMASVAPAISPDKGEERPLVCLGNVHGKSCPENVIRKMASCFQRTLSLKDHEISINKPFAGGYITRTYGELSVPWIQVELNRSLYFPKSSEHRETVRKDENQIRQLRQKFEKTLQLFFSE
jgi:formiminoglutamase